MQTSPVATLAALHGPEGRYGADTVAGLHAAVAQPWTEEYQVDYLDRNDRVFDRIDAVVSGQVWNFADFDTKPGVLRVDGNKKGAFTRDRKPKGGAHLLRRRWRQDHSPRIPENPS